MSRRAYRNRHSTSLVWLWCPLTESERQTRDTAFLLAWCLVAVAIALAIVVVRESVS